MNNQSEAERKVLQLLRSGNVADLSNGEKIDLSESSSWGPERTISSDFICWLCTNPETVKDLTPHGIRIRGGRVEGQLNLNALNIPFNISLCECFIPHPLYFRHSSVAALDMSGSRTVRIEADCLTVSGEMRLADGFQAEGPVSLMGATIKGDLSCVKGHFDNQSDQKDTTRITGCGDCRASTLHAYSLVLERAKIEGSLYLCGGFIAKGGVHLGDSIIGVNLNCTKGKFTARSHEDHHAGKTTGRRLACEGDAEHHLACAFNGEGMHVKGNLILNGIVVKGETRLTGALIDGDLDSADGKYINQGASAIHGDRLHVRGNIFFCDGFKAEGAVRLPRADIGADLSFYNGHLVHSLKDSSVLYCEGIRVQGTVYLKNFVANDGYVDLSYSTVDGNLDCTNSRFQGTGGLALRAKGMQIQGSAFFRSSASGNFQADGLVSLTGSKLGVDLICTNGYFNADKPCELEDGKFCAINADNMTIGGKVEMNGEKFNAVGVVGLDYTNIGSYLDCKHGKFTALATGEKDNYAISAGKLQTGGSVYLSDEFMANGVVMLNDASIGRNLICKNGKIINAGGYSLWAMQMKVAGYVNMDNFVSHGEVRIDYAVIGGNLNCSKGEFINNKEKNPEQEDPDGESGKRYALHANGVKIAGCVEFKNGFHADGIVSFQNADIGMSFFWLKIKNRDSAALFLDAARAGVLEDEEDSWPAKDKLQINDFEYRFLKELSPEGLKSRREKWLGLPRDFRTQPFEHLAAVLKRSGYEEDAKKVLIEKNKTQTRLPARWPWAKLLDRRCPPKDGYRQSQSPLTWILRVLFDALVCYGYKPSQALWCGLIFVVIGWVLFYQGFNNNVMVPTKDGGSNIYQIAAITTAQTGAVKNVFTNKIPMNITHDRSFYSFVYSLDTFMPVIKLQTADYWLPTAHLPLEDLTDKRYRESLGFVLCLYRWFLILSGWVISTFYIAALSGLVRR